MLRDMKCPSPTVTNWQRVSVPKTSPLRIVGTRGYPDPGERRRATTRGFDRICDQAMFESKVGVIEGTQLNRRTEVARSLRAIDDCDVKLSRRRVTVGPFATDHGKTRRTHRDAADAGGGGRRLDIDVDVDACERAVVRSCSTTTPGGTCAGELRAIVRHTRARAGASALDVTEIDVPGERAARLAALVVLAAFAGFSRRPSSRRRVS